MDLTWLDDFEALAALGNFSRAAESRHVTQPAFSRRIRALEDWAGTALFTRGAQPVGLTEAGRRIRPLLAEIGRRTRDAREEARLAAGAGAGLRFAATHALSFSFFPAWAAGLEENGPPSPLHLISDGLDGCEAAMLAGRAEFLLCHAHPAAPGRLGPPRFLSRRVGADRLCLVAAPGTGNARPPRLGYGEGSGLGRIVAAMRAGHEPPSVFTSHLAAVLRSMARDGRGEAWLPESLVAADLRDGSLVRTGAADIPVEIALVRPASVLGAAAERVWARVGPEDAA